MQLVHDSNVQARYANGFPRTVELICPFCHRRSDFEASAWQEHGRQVAATEAACARCEDSVLLLQLLDANGGMKELYTNPPSAARELMPGVEHLQALSGPLGRTYDTALKLYNHAEWGPTALMVRHLLEGLCARLLADDKRELPLPRQLEALTKDVDLTRPLQDVAQLLTPGGTFGKQFDDEAAIGKASAEQMLELAEQLISYLVVLPGTMSELKSRIATAPVPLRRGSSAG